MKINGKTKVLGLIGCPIEHTMSPFIHNLLANKMNINIIYLPFHVEKGNLKPAMLGAKALNLLGTNITVPYKVEALELVDFLDDRAKLIEAINTVKYFNNKIYGYNTDADGFLLSCIKAGITFQNKKICILGAGGASKAISLICAEKKAKKLIIANRTIDKANLLKNTIQKNFNIEVDAIGYNELKSFSNIDICIQTTSIGMHPNYNDSIINENDFFKNLEWAIDLIYNPKETKFLKLAKEKGINTLNGFGMLFFQAVKAFEIWNDVIIPESIIEECYQLFSDYIY